MRTAVVYADGSCPGRGCGGWASLLSASWLPAPALNYGMIRNTTIWRCEFYGILDALHTLNETCGKGQVNIEIVCDSEALVKSLNGEYKRAKASPELFQAYRDLVVGHVVTVTWSGRCSNFYMKLVDGIAYAATKVIAEKVTAVFEELGSEVSDIKHSDVIKSVKDLQHARIQDKA